MGANKSKEVKINEDPDDTSFYVDNVCPKEYSHFSAKIHKKGEYCSITEPYEEFGSVPFLNGLYSAYIHHYPVKFYPDDFWLLILQMFSNYVNDHAEYMRNKLVDFNGKKTLVATVYKRFKFELTPEDYQSIIAQLVKKIPDNIKDPKLVETLNPEFSTSTIDNAYVKKLTVMCSFKKFFDYEAHLAGCGFPIITLAGKVEDWEKILTNLNELIKLVPSLSIVKDPMEKIVNSKKGKVDKSFWEGMLKKKEEKEPYYLSGMKRWRKKDYLSGWILKFFNYKNEKLEVNKIEEELPSQILDVPFMLTGECNIPMMFYAGFLGMKQDEKTQQVSSVIGWYLDTDKKK